MKRTQEREWVFKIIFENQFESEKDLEEIFLNHELDLDRESFLYKSLLSYSNKKEEIEEIILNELGENPYKRLNKIDKAILSLSINEMLFLEIPQSVSINEAVNLSKKYSTQEGYKFINSVLGTLVRKEK